MFLRATVTKPTTIVLWLKRPYIIIIQIYLEESWMIHSAKNEIGTT